MHILLSGVIHFVVAERKEFLTMCLPNLNPSGYGYERENEDRLIQFEAEGCPNSPEREWERRELAHQQALNKVLENKMEPLASYIERALKGKGN